MPLYEYECLECGKRFEVFVTGSYKPVCPSCKSQKLEKLLSVFGVGGPGGSARSSSSSGCAPGGG